MNLQELDNFRLDQAVRFHDELNPAIWSDDKLQPDVRRQLLAIAQDFIDHLGLDDLDVQDITLSGSNAAYTYTPHSDLDLHLIVDMSKLDPDEVYRELFNSKKVIYNDSHDIKIHGYDVELYVQDSAEPVKSIGEYSIKNDRWIKFPRKTRTNLDERATREKFRKLIQLSQIAIDGNDLDKLESLVDTLKRYRQAGLDEHGEFGPENLAYKALRSQGVIQQLYDRRDQLHSKQLSLQENNDFEYLPPGAPDEDVERILRKIDQRMGSAKKQPHGRIIYKRPADMTGSSITDVEMVNLGFKWDGLYNKWRGTQAQWDRLYKDHGISENSYMLDKPTLTPQQIMRKHGISYEHLIDQLTQGVKVELEHTNDSSVAYQIALDHMSENPDYYTKLAKANLEEGASGYIPSNAERDDPRFKTALTVDIKPDSIQKNASKLGLGRIKRSGIPPIARTNGKS